MRTLVRIIASRMVQSRIGRWLLTAILFLIGAVSLIAYPSVTASQSSTDGLTALVTGVLFVGLGLVMLVVTIRLEMLGRRVKRIQKAAMARANELKASGQLLPIPPLPPLPKGLSPEDVTSSTLLSLALNVEDSAREIVRALVAEAAATALDREAQWVRLSENLAEDEERRAIRRLERLMQLSEESVGNPEAMDPLERAQAHITRTIEQLTAISDAITEVRRDQEA